MNFGGGGGGPGPNNNFGQGFPGADGQPIYGQDGMMYSPDGQPMGYSPDAQGNYSPVPLREFLF